ncbi:calcium-transporting ATPase sarcoplasmic/endoplasmic reticulum type [Hypoxylon trugodes]|uniref:calcium-transporting ATPase sarcoplasmic/endoplasmic reticulum type n=1 Tax=Hypoxylon trugodes TaxID=326681 RepID=UPI00218EF565|nr:calcium-transporting ATPase sarcoplasmic/endoplasmic reticulum type [Hypoxylon trugodes]KAI1385054.1 calcium-transporting ATPase sarcoplasmic/endoplasmic reticulum type [Hypoxylon trugodes]
MESAFAKPIPEVLANFKVDAKAGLTDGQVSELRTKYGNNSIPEEPPTPLWELILEQFKDQLVIILLGSAAVSFVLALFEDDEAGWSAFVDPLVILTILVLNAVVGVSQESSAEKAIAALQEYSANIASVIRNNGHISRVKAEELVPGDIVSVSVGDRIPADCRVVAIESNSFAVDQAVLTGESESVGKDHTAVVKDEKAVLQDQVNMLFSGTTVVTGRATAIVVLTGSNTAIGDIHESITAQISEPTPLKQKLNDFGDSLAKVITVICVLVWLINIPNFADPSHGNWTKGAIYYLKIAVSLGVAAIPEGLAVVITTCLALGTRKMAAKNAVVRSLPSVETLGSCSVICSDKTGTLTTNQMSVSKIVYINQDGTDLEELDVEGTTFAPKGDVTRNGKVVKDLSQSSSTIRQMNEVAALCNDARLVYDARTGAFSKVGEPTEGALRVLAEKIGPCAPANSNPEGCLHYASSWYESQFPRLATYEFSRDRKSMSVLVQAGQQKKLLVKGAPESILDRCAFTLVGAEGKRVRIDNKLRNLLMKEVVDYGNRGLRVIALASLDDVGSNPLLQNAKSTAQYAQLEQNLTLLGLVGMLDPPRPEVSGAIKKCKDAGIRVIVITGDNRNTAESICRQIGVFGEYEDLKGKSYTGREFDNLNPSEQLEAARNASLFSRVEPSHKSKLVDLLQSLGEVVAMTGDGVNDAPALKKADIGVAMGSGTDVSKLAADMVLADDNFATIEVAIEEGRSIYNNTQQFIRYLISSNIGEVVSIFLTAALGMPEALIPVQLLWVNLVTDGLPATALSFNPPDHDIMKRQPRKRDERLIGGWLFFRYLVIGTYVGIATVAGYAWWFMYNPEGPQINFYQLSHFHRCSTEFSEIGCEMFSNDMSKAASTISLSILVVIEMLNAMNALSSSESLLTLPLWENMMLVYAVGLSMALHFALLYTPVLQTLFSILPLNWTEWKAVLIISAPVIIIDEVLKAVERQFFIQKTTDEAEKAKKEA